MNLKVLNYHPLLNEFLLINLLLSINTDLVLFFDLNSVFALNIFDKKERGVSKNTYTTISKIFGKILLNNEESLSQ